VGQQVILPSSYTGSPRYMYEKNQDVMTYVRKFGRPDLFITFTCNPEWPEIKNELFQDQKSLDRHDIISRVFHLKLKKFMHVLKNKYIFGDVNCYVYGTLLNGKNEVCHTATFFCGYKRKFSQMKLIKLFLPRYQTKTEILYFMK
jgi:hypothetical protein